MFMLIVDDVEDTRTTVKLLLEYKGHEVQTAADGQEAIAVALQQVPDVVLMDLSMPVMDGLAATRVLRQIPVTSQVPIVAVSAYVRDKAWCDRAIEAGCNGCVPKPIDFDALDNVLREL